MSVGRVIIPMWLKIKNKPFTLFSLFGIINSMARPKVVRLQDGMVTLKNFSPERSKALEEAILGVPEVKKGDQLTVQEEQVKIVKPEDLSEFALGYYQDKITKKFMLAIIKYSPEFKSCQVVEVKFAGDFKPFATNAFKIELVNKGLI